MQVVGPGGEKHAQVQRSGVQVVDLSELLEPHALRFQPVGVFRREHAEHPGRFPEEVGGRLQDGQVHEGGARVEHEVPVEDRVPPVALAGVAVGRDHRRHPLDRRRTRAGEQDAVDADGRDGRRGGQRRGRPVPPDDRQADTDARRTQCRGERRRPQRFPLDEQRPGAVDQHAEQHQHGTRQGGARRQEAAARLRAAELLPQRGRQQHGQRTQHGQDVARLLADRQRVEQQGGQGPPRQSGGRRVDAARPGGEPAERWQPEQHVGRPGQHAADGDRQVVPPCPRRVVARRGEPFEVLRDEEPSEVVDAVHDGHPHEPGRGHQQERDSRGREVRAPRMPSRTARQVLAADQGRDDQGGERQRDRSLREHAAGRRNGRGDQPAPPAARIERAAPPRRIQPGQQGAPRREGDQQRERQIRQGLARQRDVPETRGGDQAGQQARRIVEPAPGDSEGQERQAEPGQRRRQAGGRFADAGQMVGAGGEPVVEHRLLEAVCIVEVRRQPVAALDHLAGALRIESLVRIGDGRLAETGEEGEPADAGKDEHVTRHGKRHSMRVVTRHVKTVAVIGASRNRRKFGSKAVCVAEAPGAYLATILGSGDARRRAGTATDTH